MKYSSYDETRTVVVYDGSDRIVKTRPYTTAENAAADANALAETLASNEAAVRSRATAALKANGTFLALASPTNAQVLAQTKMLTRECTALIRLAVRALDTADGT